MSLIMKVDSRIVREFSKVKPGSTFMSVIGYKNNYDEISDFSIVFHFSYQNAVKKAINTWIKYRAESNIQQQAKNALIDSYSRSLKNGDVSFTDHGLKDPYARVVDCNGNIIDGVKVHIKNKELHITGLLIHKRIITPGKYRSTNKSDLSKAKADLIAMTSLNNYRQFKLVDGRFKSISVDSLTLTEKDLIRKMV